MLYGFKLSLLLLVLMEYKNTTDPYLTGTGIVS